MTFKRIGTAAALGISVLALSAALPAFGQFGQVGYLIGAAHATDNDGSTGGQDQGQGNQGGQGQGGQGAQAGQGNQGGQGAGQGGPDPDSDSKGPQAGGPSSAGSGGGKPVWAQEGIPEVELGRLSVARSPDQVLQRAFDEALANFTADMASFYSMSLDEMIFALSDETTFDSLTFIDSPLQNLALLKDALDGTSVLTSVGVANSNDTLLAAFLGTASDKTLTITPDTVTAVTTILGTPLSEAEAAALAADAEAIRIAVLAGHG